MSANKLHEIKARLQRLEDERDLRALIARYGHYADLGYEDAYVDQFTDDGIYDIVTVMRKGAGYVGNVRFEGREALYAHIRDPAAHKQFEGRSLHFQDINCVIHVDGDAATAESYSMTVLEEADQTIVRSAGMNRWRFRRVDGRWRIAEKRRRPPGDAEVFKGIA